MNSSQSKSAVSTTLIDLEALYLEGSFCKIESYMAVKHQINTVIPEKQPHLVHKI